MQHRHVQALHLIMNIFVGPVALALMLAIGTADAAPESCPPAGDFPIPLLPHTRAALATNQPLVVVALGSSSTRGWMATNVAHSYPALLQRELNDALPQADFAIINRGIGGQDAPEELARLDSDVLSIHPQMVIWQVGANGAVRDASPDAFKRPGRRRHRQDEGSRRRCHHDGQPAVAAHFGLARARRARERLEGSRDRFGR